MPDMLTASAIVLQDLEHVTATLADEMRLLEGKKVLITGGAGFLGYYLVQAPVHWNRTAGANQPVHVAIFDNYVRGVPEWLEQLRRDGEVELHRHDVTQPLPARMDEFDYIIHAASIASPSYYRKHPIETMDANVNGLRSLLDYARLRCEAGAPISGFLFFSTSEIYGDPEPDHIPTPETYRGYVSCTGPRACYDESKRFGETLCVNFARIHSLPISIARPFNNYGPGLKITDGRVIPDFARDVFAGNDIVMWSDGSPTRTYCYIADAIAGYYKVLLRGRAGEAYNIGTEAPEVSTAELAERLAGLARELFGYRGRVVQRTSADRHYLTDNPNRRCPDITKARTELGYAPAVTLDEGLRRSLLWYHEHRSAAEA